METFYGLSCLNDLGSMWRMKPLWKEKDTQQDPVQGQLTLKVDFISKAEVFVSALVMHSEWAQ